MAPNYDIATRAFVLGLKCSGKTSSEVASISGLSSRHIDRIYAKAIKRGFDPTSQPVVIKDDFLRDAPRSGRPSKQTKEVEDRIMEKMVQEKTGADIARELSSEGLPISATTVCRILKSIQPVPKVATDDVAWTDEECEGASTTLVS